MRKEDSSYSIAALFPPSIRGEGEKEDAFPLRRCRKKRLDHFGNGGEAAKRESEEGCLPIANVQEEDFFFFFFANWTFLRRKPPRRVELDLLFPPRFPCLSN